MDDTAKVLGKIVMNFNALEFVFASFAGKFITKDANVAAIVTSEMSFSNLIKMSDALLRYKFPDKAILKKWETIRKRLTLSEQERNIYVHSKYLNLLETNGLTRVKISAKVKRSLHVDRQEVSIDNMAKVLREQVQLINELVEFNVELFKDEHLLTLPLSDNKKK